MEPYDAQYHIVNDLFIINNNEINEDDFSLDFNGRLLIIELKNNYNYNQIISILSSVMATGYFISRYFINSENIKNKLLFDENEFLKY